MPQITLDLDVVAVDGRSIFDPRLSVLARRSNNDSPLRSWLLEPWEGLRRLGFDSDAEHLDFSLHVAPSRYELGTLLYSVHGNRIATTEGRFCMPRRPSKWIPQFVVWQELPGEFGALKTMLTEKSPVFRCGRTSSPGKFIRDRFDAIVPERSDEALPKMSLLNLYSRLGVENMPATNQPWFGEVQSLLYSDRERVVGEISPDCWQNVQTTAERGRDGYEGVAVIQDHLDNLRDGTGVTEISSPFSIKSGTAKANLQLTVAKGRKNGKDVFLLDADFDENSKPLLHVFDVIEHKFNGGTPPIYVHECLRRVFGDGPLAYTLQPGTPIAETDARMITTPR
jgi:hypothetical protein